MSRSICKMLSTHFLTIPRVLFFSWLILITFFIASSAFAAHKQIDWNGGAIHWQEYEEAFVESAKQGKPIILIFYADWCPVCGEYATIFSNKQVVEKSQNFIMVRLNVEERKKLNRLYDLDGRYFPRTIFINPEGKVMHKLYTRKRKNRYFLNPTNPTELLNFMDRALQNMKK